MEDYIGLKIKEDILDLLDDGWVIFDAPSSGGLLGSGFTLVIETKSADKVDQLIRKGLDGLSDMTGNEGKFIVSSFDHAGHKVHTVHRRRPARAGRTLLGLSRQSPGPGPLSPDGHPDHRPAGVVISRQPIHP